MLRKWSPAQCAVQLYEDLRLEIELYGGMLKMMDLGRLEIDYDMDDEWWRKAVTHALAEVLTRSRSTNRMRVSFDGGVDTVIEVTRYEGRETLRKTFIIHIYGVVSPYHINIGPVVHLDNVSDETVEGPHPKRRALNSRGCAPA